MIITITGPRSVGKSTISNLVAKKLKLNLVSSDQLGEDALKELGGLDSAIKSGAIGKFIEDSAYGLIRKEYMNDNFVFDLSGGSISSTKHSSASEKVREIAKAKSIIFGLLPFKEENSSIDLLFNREKERVHFKEMNKEDLFEKVKKDFLKFPLIFEGFCDFTIYTENKTPKEIAGDILKKLKLL